MEAEATTVRPSLAAAAADLAQGGSEKQKMGKRVRKHGHHSLASLGRRRSSRERKEEGGDNEEEEGDRRREREIGEGSEEEEENGK